MGNMDFDIEINLPEIAVTVPIVPGPVEIKQEDIFQMEDEHDLGAEVRVVNRGEPGEVRYLLVPHTDSHLSSTTGKNMLPVSVPTGVEAWEFRAALTGAFQTYLQTGRLNSETAAKFAGLSQSRVEAIASTEEFAVALSYRGVDATNSGRLTPEQDAALLILTDIGSRKSWGGRLRDAGITHAIFQAWMQNPSFARAFSGISEQITGNSGVALVELGRKVGEGDTQAIKLQLEINGRHNPAQQSMIDTVVVMNRILESLATHLAGNPEILRLIAADMRKIAAEAQAKPITAEPITPVSDFSGTFTGGLEL